MEGLYNGKEKEMLKEGKQSVRKERLSKAVRKPIGRGVNWEDEWEEEEGLVVGELGRRMVTEEWSMGDKALVQKRRVTRRESTTFACVSNDTNVPKLSQKQPFSLQLDSAKCNLDENTKGAWVHASC